MTAAERAASALRRIARDVALKTRLEADPVLFPLLMRAARRYIGGSTRAQCLDTVRALRARGHTVTVDYMGENTREEALADAETEEMLALAADLGGVGRCSVSLDLSHIGLAVDSEVAFANARRVALAVRAIGSELIISMEGSERTGDILAVYRRLCGEFDNVGVTLQARLHRTAADLPEMMRLGKVRLVKGAYEEPLEVACPRDGDVLRERYVGYALQLMRGPGRASIATHDASIHDELARAAPPRPGLEFEVLYGLGDEQIDRLRARGYATRVYVVYGSQSFLYVCHRLAEEPSRVLDALADIIGDGPAPDVGRGSALFPHR